MYKFVYILATAAQNELKTSAAANQNASVKARLWPSFLRPRACPKQALHVITIFCGQFKCEHLSLVAATLTAPTSVGFSSY